MSDNTINLNVETKADTSGLKQTTAATKELTQAVEVQKQASLSLTGALNQQTISVNTLGNAQEKTASFTTKLTTGFESFIGKLGNITGAVSAITGVVDLFQKAWEAVIDCFDRGSRTIDEIKTGNSVAQTNNLSESLDRLADSFNKAAQARRDQETAESEAMSAEHERDKARLERDKAAELAATDPNDTAAIAEIEKKYAALGQEQTFNQKNAVLNREEKNIDDRDAEIDAEISELKSEEADNLSTFRKSVSNINKLNASKISDIKSAWTSRGVTRAENRYDPLIESNIQNRDKSYQNVERINAEIEKREREKKQNAARKQILATRRETIETQSQASDFKNNRPPRTITTSIPEQQEMGNVDSRLSNLNKKYSNTPNEHDIPWAGQAINEAKGIGQEVNVLVQSLTSELAAVRNAVHTANANARNKGGSVSTDLGGE